MFTLISFSVMDYYISLSDHGLPEENTNATVTVTCEDPLPLETTHSLDVTSSIDETSPSNHWLSSSVLAMTTSRTTVNNSHTSNNIPVSPPNTTGKKQIF